MNIRPYSPPSRPSACGTQPSWATEMWRAIYTPRPQFSIRRCVLVLDLHAVKSSLGSKLGLLSGMGLHEEETPQLWNCPIRFRRNTVCGARPDMVCPDPARLGWVSALALSSSWISFRLHDIQHHKRWCREGLGSQIDATDGVSR